MCGSKTMKSHVPEFQGHLRGGHNTEQPLGSPLLSTNMVLVTTNVPFAPSAHYSAEQPGISRNGLNLICWFCLLFFYHCRDVQDGPLEYQMGLLVPFRAYVLSITEAMDPFSILACPRATPNSSRKAFTPNTIPVSTEGILYLLPSWKHIGVFDNPNAKSDRFSCYFQPYPKS